MLASFPYNTLQVDHWLIEVNKLDQRSIDAYFHRNGYVNAETFINSRGRAHIVRSDPGRVWLDSLYSRRDKPAIYPSLMGFRCDPSQRSYRLADCARFDEDMPTLT